MTLPLSVALYAFHILALPLLLIGAIRKGKALLQGRKGPPLLQPFHDIAKLFRKGETISSTSYWAFYAAPIVGIAALTAVAFMAPWLGIASPIRGDIFLFVYLLVLAKFATSLSALDTGSSFGAIGASRETAVSLFTEPAMVSALAALAIHAHSSGLQTLLTSDRSGRLESAALAGLVSVALWMAAMADLSRMPIDDPNTHLELTMIHEAQILENSGRNLALVQYAVALRTVVLVGLTARVVELIFPPLPLLESYAVTILMLAAAAGMMAVSDTMLVRLRWRRLPNLLSFAVAAGMVASLLAALKG